MIGSPVILSRSEAEAKNLLVGDAGRANRFDHGQFHRRSFRFAALSVRIDPRGTP
jgi:hypothetical protein